MLLQSRKQRAGVVCAVWVGAFEANGGQSRLNPGVKMGGAPPSRRRGNQSSASSHISCRGLVRQAARAVWFPGDCQPQNDLGGSEEEMKFKISGPTSIERMIICSVLGFIIACILADWLLPHSP